MIWDTLNQKFQHFAEGDGSLFPEELRIDAWNWAQRLFCAHTPRQRLMTAVIDTGERSIVLPDDWYAAHLLYDTVEERYWWPRSTHRPGEYRLQDDTVLEYWEWAGKLYLESSVSYTSQDLTMYYWAYWPDVEYTGSGSTIQVTQPHIHTPKWAELPLMHLTVSQTLIPEEIFASDINLYKLRYESGDPLDNPRMQSSRWHMEVYEHLIAKMPPAREI